MTKRKQLKGGSDSACKPRKRVAFSAPKAATKAIIARNASTSLLLKLPLEIRNKIWNEVLGDRLIHIDYLYDDLEYIPEDRTDFEINESLYRKGSPAASLCASSAWRHIVCEDDCSENRPDESKVIPSTRDGGEDIVLWGRPHHFCTPDYDGPDDEEPIEFWGHETMRLTILRASRQIYVEANQILWTSNTFSFHHAVAFTRFMMTRNAHQKRLIQSLRFKMVWDPYESWNWNKALNMAVVKSLSGLHNIRLQVHVWDHTQAFWDKDVYLKRSIACESLRRLSILPLTSAEVAVRTSKFGLKDGDKLKGDEEWFADALQKLLVDPHGAEIYKKAQQEQKRGTGCYERLIRCRPSLGWGGLFLHEI